METNPKKKKIAFVISHVKAQEDCRTIYNLMNGMDGTPGDLPSFTAFDASIDQPWLDTWADIITTAETYKTDETYRDELREKTQDVEAAMKNAKDAYKELKYFVTKAFPTNKAVQDQFGFDEYDKARRSDRKLREFMETLFRTATTHTEALLNEEVGYTGAKIANLKTMADALSTENEQQEDYKKMQSTVTQTRIENLNAMWTRRQQIAAAAKIIYDENYAKYHQYLLPPSEGSPDDFAIMGTVNDSTGTGPIEGAILNLSIIDLSVESDELGAYGFADNIPAGDYILTASKEGYQSQEASVTVTSADETITVNINLEPA